MKPVVRKGKLISWKDDRGFGFIQPSDGGSEVFIHITGFKDVNFRPQVGDFISYQVTNDKNGKVRAYNALIEGVISKHTHDFSSATTSKSLRAKSVVISPSLVLKTFVLSLLPGYGSIHLALRSGNLIPVIIYPVMSLVTFALYADDKSRAKQGKWRVPEKNLHLCELMGGWLGAFVAQQQLRHKSSKVAYQVVFWVIAILHIWFWFDWLFLDRYLINMLMNLIISYVKF